MRFAFKVKPTNVNIKIKSQATAGSGLPDSTRLQFCTDLLSCISCVLNGPGEYNELMNCQVKDELVSQLIALNNKLNLLSPDLVYGDEERAEVQQRRESLYAEIKHHRAKGHEGKPCPAVIQV